MEYPINQNERPEHRVARQRTIEESVALWFIEGTKDTDRLTSRLPVDRKEVDEV